MKRHAADARSPPDLNSPRDKEALRTIKLLTAASVLLGVMCLLLTLSWRAKAAESDCYRQALVQNETPAVADTDCAAGLFGRPPTFVFGAHGG